jgi:hypothetical protein
MATPADSYTRIARISYLDGHIGFQHAGDTDWSAASINMPLQLGDRIYTGEDGRAEIQFDDGSVCRLAERTDIELLSLSDDLTQIRILVGLATVIVNSGITHEIDTPAVAFTTLQKGKYRFDVVDNGDTDGIVRKGLLEASNSDFTKDIRTGELLHVAAEGNSTETLSRYGQRDEWDEWNDRRDADMTVYARNSYLPDNIYMGVGDLDVYGRWVNVDPYGISWMPLNMPAWWSPYSNGRWCYRPVWGWTWISYEPWGWLPFHYGRWYYASTHGWCWIPGSAISFNFWSPGLVRFYYGPDWISWCPLGPGDYYNVNNYFYHTTYIYQLNDIRLAQNRAPGNLINRDAPRAFHTVKNDQFVKLSYRPEGSNGVERMGAIDKPWKNGKIVEDQLNVRPTAQSYSPAPDRPSAKPSHELTRPVIVRSEPSISNYSGKNFVRITNRNAGSSDETRSDNGKKPERGASGNTGAVGNPIRTEKGASSDKGGIAGGGQPIEGPIIKSQGTTQGREENRNPTRTYQVPQNQNAPSATDDSKSRATVKGSSGQEVQAERNQERRTIQPRIDRKPSGNKEASPESVPKGEGSQDHKTSNIIISPADRRGTRNPEPSARTSGQTNPTTNSFSGTRSAHSQSRTYDTQVQEQLQSGSGNVKSGNGSSSRTPSYSGVSRSGAQNPSSGMNQQGSTALSPNPGLNSGGNRTNSGTTRNEHSANARDARTQSSH